MSNCIKVRFILRSITYQRFRVAYPFQFLFSSAYNTELRVYIVSAFCWRQKRNPWTCRSAQSELCFMGMYKRYRRALKREWYAGKRALENLWLRIKEQTSVGDTAVGICCRPPDPAEQVAEAFHRQAETASMGEQPGYLLERHCSRLPAMQGAPGTIPAITDGGASADRGSAGPRAHNKERLPGEVKVKGTPAAVTMKQTWSSSGICLEESHGINPCKRGPKKFIDEEKSLSKKLKTGLSWTAGSPERVPRVLCAWTRRSLQNSNTKKALYRKRRLGQITLEEYRSTAQEYRDVVRQATAHLDRNMQGGVNGYLFIWIWS